MARFVQLIHPESRRRDLVVEADMNTQLSYKLCLDQLMMMWLVMMVIMIAPCHAEQPEQSPLNVAIIGITPSKPIKDASVQDKNKNPLLSLVSNQQTNISYKEQTNLQLGKYLVEGLSIQTQNSLLIGKATSSSETLKSDIRSAPTDTVITSDTASSTGYTDMPEIVHSHTHMPKKLSTYVDYSLITNTNLFENTSYSDSVSSRSDDMPKSSNISNLEESNIAYSSSVIIHPIFKQREPGTTPSSLSDDRSHTLPSPTSIPSPSDITSVVGEKQREISLDRSGHNTSTGIDYHNDDWLDNTGAISSAQPHYYALGDNITTNDSDYRDDGHSDIAFTAVRNEIETHPSTVASLNNNISIDNNGRYSIDISNNRKKSPNSSIISITRKTRKYKSNRPAIRSRNQRNRNITSFPPRLIRKGGSCYII